MLYCENCHAPIAEESAKCPYCGALNALGGEKQYMERLYDIKKGVEELSDAPAREYRREIGKTGRVILLCVILFVQAVTFIREASDYLKLPEIDEGTLIQEVNGRQYERLVENVYRNEALGVPVEGDMAEIYAAAYYYEAAMLYNAHKKAGNEQQAEEKYAQMQMYEEQMGTYAFAKEEIWAFLGMDPEILK